MGKQVELVVDHLTLDGVGVAKIELKPVYIPNTIENEKVLVNIDHEGRKQINASVVKVLEKDKDRVFPKCSVYFRCGGCHLSMMNYQRQLKYKTDKVIRIFKTAALNCKIMDCEGMDNPYNYRNKVQVPVGRKNGKIIAGFFAGNTHNIVPFDKCLVQDDYSNLVVSEVILAMAENNIEPYDEDKGKGIIRHLLIRRAIKETMLVLITTVDSFPGRNNLVQSIKKRLPDITTIVQNINGRKTNVILGDKEKILFGKGYINDTLLGVSYKISPKSFYQINKTQIEKIYTKAIELANVKKSDTILDAYCGIGTIGLSVARKVKKLVGVEVVQDAIDNAIENAKENNITNAEFVCDEAEKFVQTCNTRFDVVFVDPPRKGCDKKFLEALVKTNVKKIIYISCNPETQANDLKYLSKYYYFKEVYLYDMFPQTFHVETIVSLKLK